LLRWGAPYRRSSRRARPWKEPSGTIVHGVLEELDAERRVILWNTVPTHPHLPAKPLSNRRPTQGEIAAGRAFVERLIDITQPRLLIGVGRIACGALPGAQYVRHPAQSGATAFRLGMRALLDRERFLDAVERIGDALELFEPLDVGGQRFPASAGSGRRDRVAGDREDRFQAVGLDVHVMGGNCVYQGLGLAEPFQQFPADDGV